MSDSPRPIGVRVLRTPAEFDDAVSAMTRPERLRLSAMSRVLEGSSGMTGDDLIQEAYARALEGIRTWPHDVPVVSFMIGIMKSIASSARETEALARRVKVVPFRGAIPSQPDALLTPTGELFDLHQAPRNPEEILIGLEDDEAETSRLRAHRDQLLAVFEDDDEAQLLVMGKMDGLKGEDLRDATGLSGDQFATKYKKVARRIEALRRSQP